ncbi:polysaccharide lyase [Echinicola marina]|uniref:polysaccharide lyase n=1 Tax=Echinicola marina TaxID=2859768 RepID=UPI001CF6AA73|nr:polysaccharide lyase [Echinicola marina]UCS92974.1 polysaccharide lyase [Echinicola marina]
MKITNNALKSLLAFSVIGLVSTSCEMTDFEEDNIVKEEFHAATGISSSPNIEYQETFEGSDPFSFAHKQLSEDYSLTIASSPVVNGSGSGRFELNDYDPLVSNGTRAEVLFPELSYNERWYSYSLYLPSKDFQIDSNNDIISQWHQGSGSGSPTTTLRIKDDRFFLKSGPTKEERKDYDIAAVKKDAWNEFVFHIVHSSGSEGLVEVWMNGEKVLHIEGGNMNKDYGLPRWKIGIYKDNWNGSGTTDTDRRVMFFDNVRLGNQNASYEEMTSRSDDISSISPEEEEETAITNPEEEETSGDDCKLTADSNPEAGNAGKPIPGKGNGKDK